MIAADLTKKRSVLITGGAGFIGSHLVEECLRRNWHVEIIDSLESGSLAFLPPAGNLNLLRRNICNLGEDDAAKYAGRIDYVMHLAAEPFIPRSFIEPDIFVSTNIIGTMKVMKLAKDIGAERVLVVSSSEVYGDCPAGTWLTEESEVDPQSTYAVTKLAAERLAITSWKERGVPAIVFRPFNCYGPRPTQLYVVPDIIAQAYRTGVVKLGNIDSCRDFTFVTDMAWAMAEIVDKGSPGQVYHYGSGSARTIKSVVNVVSDVLRKPIKIEIDGTRLRPADVTWLLASNKKFDAHVCCGRDHVAFGDGVWRMVKWFQENGEKWPYEKG